MSHIAAKTIRLAAFLQYDGGKLISLPVCSARLMHSIDSLPTVQLDVQLNNDLLQSVGMDIQTFVTLSRKTQEYLVNKFRLNTDMQVIVEDGDGNRLAFQGFMSNPTFAISGNEVMLNYSVAHRCIGMQAFNAGIYDFAESYGHVDESATQAGVQDVDARLVIPFDTDSIAARLSAILVNLGSSYEKKLKANAEMPDVLLPYHNINKGAYANFIKPFLEKSFPLTMIPYTGDKIGRVSGGMQANVINSVMQQLLMESENFMAAIPGIAQAFKFQFNCNWEGESWLEPIRTHQITEERFIKVPYESIRFNVGSTYELPLLKVFVSIPEGSDSYAYSDVLPSGSPLFAVTDSARVIRDNPEIFANAPAAERDRFIQFPEFDPTPTDIGTYLLVAPPNWISQDAALYTAKTDTKDTSALDPQKGLEGLADRKTRANQMDFERRNILKWVAQRTYEEQFLKSCMASATLPLCVNVQVGLTYEVRDQADMPIFTGYLASCVHTVSLENQNASGRTDLIFSHVKAAGVKFSRIKGDLKNAAFHLMTDILPVRPAVTLPGFVQSPVKSMLARNADNRPLQFGGLVPSTPTAPSLPGLTPGR